MLVGALIVVAGIIKYREGSGRLQASIDSFKILPSHLLPVASAVLPPLEVVVGVAIIFGLGVMWTTAGLGLLAAYTLAIIAALARRMTNDCGCFGAVMRRRSSPALVVRNAVFMALLAPSLWWGASVNSMSLNLAMIACIIASCGWRLVRVGRAVTDNDSYRSPVR
ncbi:hypothetical protein GSU40_15555 [Rathayibacter sp. VKM Ac-2805]|nr:hypothetical protein GSU40_15555 [Rathayibacter sp. VKM Ac-2805]